MEPDRDDADRGGGRVKYPILGLRVPRPDPPTKCQCGSTDFKWDAGFKGSQTEPPEPSGWYCHECENRDFEGEEE